MMKSIVAERIVLRKETFKGCYIFSIKKDGTRYKNPTWYNACGLESNPNDILARLQMLNPSRKFEIA